MNARRIQRILAGILVLASLLVCWSIHQAAKTRRRQKIAETQRLTQDIAALRQENLRLSQQTNQTLNKETLSHEELRELLRLRNEVTQLRRMAREIGQLRAANQQFQAQAGAQAPTESASTTNQAGYWARDQFAYAGFSDPESALKTTLWLWVDASLDSILALCTPEQRSELEKQRSEAETDLATQHRGMQALYNLDKGGVSLLSKKMNSSDEAVLDLYFEGDGKVRRFVLNKSGGQWVVNRLDAIYH